MVLSTSGIRVDGLFSNIDYSGIIEKLLAVERGPITLLQQKITDTTQKQTAYSSVSAKLLNIMTSTNTLSKASFFNTTVASSSDSTVLTASGSNISTTGSFLFTPYRLAQAHQSLSDGVTDSDTTTIGAGTITIDTGPGYLNRTTSVEMLNGQTGIDRGKILVTNKNGTAYTVDLTNVTNVQDVLDEINNTAGIGVKASVQGDRVIVEDTTGGGGTLKIENYGSDTTAESFGINGTSGAGSNFIYGSQINYLTSSTNLAYLNDGNGIRFNNTGINDLMITPKTGVGNEFYVDFDENDTTVGDIIQKINDAATGAGVNVTASLNADKSGILIQDTTGGAGVVSISAQNNSNAIIDLGLYNVTAEKNGIQDAVTGDTISGRRIFSGLNSVLRYSLNGGQRLYYADGSPANDFNGVADGTLSITDRAGTNFQIKTAGREVATTLQANFTAPGNVIDVTSASSMQVGDRIRIEEGAFTEYRTINSISGTQVTLDSNLVNDYTTNANVYVDRYLNADYASGATTMTLISTAGVTNGTKLRVSDGTNTEYRTVTNVAGNVVTFDSALNNNYTGTGAETGRARVYIERETLNDVIDAVNNQATTSGVLIEAGINTELNGILIKDKTGSTASNLIVANYTGTAADSSTGLGVAVNSAVDSFNGSDVNLQYISESTKLNSLNNGEGVFAGKFQVVDRDGVSFTVDLSQTDDDTIGDAILEINAAAALAGSDLTSRINDEGNGILLEDTTGTGTIKVLEKENGTTAADLNILNEVSASTLDGSFKFDVTVDATDTLDDVASKINLLGINISASIINDGSALNPYRLNLISTRSGEKGRFVIDSDNGMNFSSVSIGQDAVVLYGTTSGGGAPAVIKSSTNTFSNIVSGLTVDVKSTSNSPVTVSVNRDEATITDTVSEFVQELNDAVSSIRDLTDYNTDTSTAAVLFGDSTVNTIERRIFDTLLSTVTGIPSSQINVLTEIGITLDNAGHFLFDESKFKTALSENFSEVRNLFTKDRTLDLTTKLEDFRNGLGLDFTQGDDLNIHRLDGVDVNVNLSSADTVADLINLINYDADNTGNLLVASISGDNQRIVLTDNSTPSGSDSFQVTNLNNSTIADQLGIKQNVGSADTIEGSAIDLSKDPGIAAKLYDLLTALTDASDGVLSNKIDSLDNQVDGYQDKIETLEERLSQLEERYVREFSQLEIFLADSQGVMDRLSTSLSNVLSGFKTNKG